MTTPAPVQAWHRIAAARDEASLADLDALLAEECVFRSPAVHTPQEGKPVTTAYLLAAMAVLGPTLRYLDEWYAVAEDGGGSAVLEFGCEVGGRSVHGVDMLRWGADGRLTSFTAMIRPAQGLEAVVAAMGAELSRA
ncbi:nuclear transport factor 2 family protein [Nocardioides dongxiaopingii]|uniref:nuclear transport factor 2 family protein n=1 Tax=Nocardioides dongxiaopingii TaxID=2576036 RepID=UPI0010C7703C|nr:nuclear transport factor 2 family protein [Nocardioides dongxiaopingii]